MHTIRKVPSVCVCFAVDNNYAPYLRVTIKSLILNRNTLYGYDILIMHSDITDANQKVIVDLCNNQAGVSIRFIDISEMRDQVEYEVRGYWSVATNYRLFLFSDLFSEYDKILYLDGDIIINGDISELFFTDMGDKYIAGVEDIGFRYLYMTKRAVFIDGKYPYNVMNYRTDALKMKHPLDYVNGGVLLINLANCRKAFDYAKVLQTLHSKRFNFNDQDVVNILADGHVMKLDVIWNYQNCINVLYRMLQEEYQDVLRNDFRIIHYVGGSKPWKEEVELGEYYHDYDEG